MSHPIRDRIVHLRQCPSTNDLVLNDADREDPVWIWTLDQRNGRGSRGRNWTSPKGAGLAISVGFTSPPFPNPRGWCYPLLAGVLLMDGLGALGLADGLGLKWPNDVTRGSQKVAGVLCESRWMGDRVRIALGFGLNRRDHPDYGGLGRSYGWVEAEGNELDPEALITHMDSLFFESVTARWSPQDLTQAWLQRSRFRPGGTLLVAWQGRETHVRFLGLREDGSLRFEDDAGGQHVVSHTHTDLTILNWDAS